MQKTTMRDASNVSSAVRTLWHRAALLYLAVLAVIVAAGLSPQQSFGQGGATESLNWKAKVHYSQTATSPKAHRVQTLNATFDLRTGLIATQEFTEDYEWKNVTIAYSDSGRWHLDPEDMDEWSGPSTDGWWNVSDTLTIPLSKSNHVYDDLKTRRPHGKVNDLHLPTLPVQKTGSIVLVQPSGVGFLLDVGYNKTQNIFTPGQGNDVTDLSVHILGKQPVPVPGENIEASEDTSGEYEGLTPEIAQMMKMMETMTEGAEDESEDDQVSLMALKMNGYVEFEGDPVVGSRQWTTPEDSSGEYTHSFPDSLTTLTHEMSWEFVPVKNK